MKHLLSVPMLFFIALTPSESLGTPLLSGKGFLSGLSLIKDGETYYMFALGDIEGMHLYNSTDFQSWTESTIEMESLNKTAWFAKLPSENTNTTFKIFNPSIHKMNETYFMYFAIELGNSDAWCLGVASAKTIHGPYISTNNPLTCKYNTSQVFSPYVIENCGQKVMFYNYMDVDELGVGGVAVMSLTDDGLSPKSEELFIFSIKNNSRADAQNIHVFPRVVKINNNFFLFYFFEEGIYVSRSTEILGPFNPEVTKLFMAKSVMDHNFMVSSFVPHSDGTYQFFIGKLHAGLSLSYSVSAKKFKMVLDWPVLVN